MAKTFSQRIERAIASGDLIVADLHHWFERPYPTVRLWRFGGTRKPPGPRGALAEARLKLLETAIVRKQGFPVPATLSSTDRPAYIKKVRHDLENAGVFKGYPA